MLPSHQLDRLLWPVEEDRFAAKSNERFKRTVTAATHLTSQARSMPIILVRSSGKFSFSGGLRVKIGDTAKRVTQELMFNADGIEYL